jgi:hypothetical protein
MVWPGFKPVNGANSLGLFLVLYDPYNDAALFLEVRSAAVNISKLPVS